MSTEKKLEDSLAEIALLKDEILKLKDENKTFQDMLDKVQSENKLLLEQLNLYKQNKFGASSEKSDIYNEVESVDDKNNNKKFNKTKSNTSKAINFDKLPNEDVFVDLETKACDTCNSDLVFVREETSKVIVSSPATTKVVTKHLFIYACKNCETIVTAKTRLPVIPGGNASPSIISNIICMKYLLHLPLDRMEKWFAKNGLILSKQTMSNWLIYSVEHYLSLIYNRIKQILISTDYLMADETSLRVIGNDKLKSYMWVFLTPASNVATPSILYHFYKDELESSKNGTRGRIGAEKFLEGFSGYLTTDGYTGYNEIDKVINTRCWTHARRNYVDAIKITRNKKAVNNIVAERGLEYCNKLYEIEWQCIEQNLDYQQIKEVRNTKSKVILDEFYDWLNKEFDSTINGTLIHKAINYTLNNWKELNNYLLDGRIEIDNNRSERAIKPFVIGRKNWLFCQTSRGAEVSAILHSLVETATLNRIDVYKYFDYILDEMSNMSISKESDIDNLLPWSKEIQEKLSIKK